MVPKALPRAAAQTWTICLPSGSPHGWCAVFATCFLRTLLEKHAWLPLGSSGGRYGPHVAGGGHSPLAKLRWMVSWDMLCRRFI